MRKFFSFFLLGICIIGAILGSLYFYHSKNSDKVLDKNYCAFCDEKVLKAQKFYEDDLIAVLYTHKPIFPGHCLIIPKRHIQRFEELSDEEILQIGRAIKKVNLAVQKVFKTSAYLLLQKNGYEVGQSIFHVHFHYVPRKAKDASEIKFIIKMYLADIKRPMSQAKTQKIVEKMRRAIIGIILVVVVVVSLTSAAAVAARSRMISDAPSDVPVVVLASSYLALSMSDTSTSDFSSSSILVLVLLLLLLLLRLL